MGGFPLAFRTTERGGVGGCAHITHGRSLETIERHIWGGGGEGRFNGLPRGRGIAGASLREFLLVKSTRKGGGGGLFWWSLA